MQTIYAVGDIHGYLGQMHRALDLIDRDGGSDAPVVFLGDYVDRGPNSRGVVETLMQGMADGRPWRALRGNHDRMFSRFVRGGVTADPMIKSGKTWLHDRLGGQTTLASYFDYTPHPEIDAFGVDPVLATATQALQEQAAMAVPEEHLVFLEGLPLTIEEPGLLFVHAGINPKVPFGMQDEEDLLWIRDGWLTYTGLLRALVVHGHTALEYPQHHGNRVNLDGGAGYGRPLVPVAIETDGQSHRLYSLDEAGRKPLLPS